jgi:hypothetical protein
MVEEEEEEPLISVCSPDLFLEEDEEGAALRLSMATSADTCACRSDAWCALREAAMAV